ncbi:hypothetical protein [uncultured Thiocystis sp.]|uniref:hypothetical protein n=1 Tax=uncultured Thiocystis sp. TaxID=1202134 RepID=UPI0025E6C452|nr:hypothetical protein [uncultured Thiocystis sp.]
MRAKAALDVQIQVWKPTPGDCLEGRIVGSRQSQGPFGDQPQMLVQTPINDVNDAPVIIATWLTPWLKDQLRTQQAALGDLLSLTFGGKETSKTGKAFNRMTLTVLKTNLSGDRDACQR